MVTAARFQKLATGYVARGSAPRKEVRAIELTVTMALLLLILWITRK